MSLFNDIYREVEDLRGMLCAIMVNFPDTDIRIKPCIEKMDTVMNGPTDENIYFLVEDMIDLRSYLSDIGRFNDELSLSVQDPIMLIDRLLGTTNPESLH